MKSPYFKPKSLYNFILLSMKECIKVYDNQFKNLDLTGLTELENFLQLIADLDEEIELFAIGGTAMILKNIKEATKDIDFLTTAPYEKIKRLFILAGLKEKDPSKLCNIWYLGKIRIDIFHNEFIMGFTLPDDWKEASIFLKNIGKLKLYILNWYDLIITKIARSEGRDIEDILDNIKAEKIDFKKLKKRYYGHAEISLIAEYDLKFKHLEEKYKE